MKRLFLFFSVLALLVSLCACKDTEPRNGIRSVEDSETTTEPPGAPETQEVFNNGGRYVQCGGDVYYWEYTADSVEPTGIWGEFAEVPGVSRPLARLAADGKTQRLFTEDGYGGIWIHGGRLYLTRKAEGGYGQIFSVSMEAGDTSVAAKNRRALGPGRIFALDEARGLLIATVEKFKGHLCVINMETGQREELPPANVQPLLYDQASATLYYRDNSAEGPGTVKLCAVSVTTGAVRDIALVDAGQYGEDLEVADWIGIDLGSVRLEGGKLYMYLAGYGGNAHVYYAGAALAVDLAGDGVTENKNPGESDWYGVNRPFTSDSAGPFEGAAGDTWSWTICPGQGKPPLMVLSEQDLAGLGLPAGPFFGEEDFAALRDVEYVDGALFFLIARGPRNEAEDIGWREAYDLASMRAYHKDIATGEIAQLYSIGAQAAQAEG